MNIATQTGSNSDYAFYKTPKCANEAFKFIFATLCEFISCYK